MKTFLINPSSPYLDEVIALADENSGALGFLPEAAFHQSAHDHNIIVAIDENKKFLGYLLFNFSKTKRITSITHLCVKELSRRRGIGKALVDELIKLSETTSYGIRVHCRRDWKAHEFWPKMGFIAKNEKSGRSKMGSILTIYWYDHGYPDLFTSQFDVSQNEKVYVAIDANILFDITDKNNRNRPDSSALLAEWLSSEIELCVTNEIYNEIDRNDDPEARKRSKSLAQSLKNIPFGKVDNDQQELIDEIFTDIKTIQDESDKRQIERTVAKGISYFVTRDKKLLEKSDKIKSLLGLSVLRPAELIIHIDSLRRDSEYHASRLAGLNIKYKRIESEELKEVIETFLWPTEEKKSEFSLKLNSIVADPNKFEAMTIIDGYSLKGLIAFSSKIEGILEIPVFRIPEGQLFAPLVEFLLMKAINKASSSGFPLLKISEKYLKPEFISIIKNRGFIKEDDAFWRISLQGQYSFNEFSEEIRKLMEQGASAQTYLVKLQQSIQKTQQTLDNNISLSLEKSVWPVKFYNTNLENYIVPIQPQYAIELFDSELGKLHLFGGKPTLVLISENAYYRSSHPKILNSPGRILWYVSSGKNQMTKIQSIRACSYIDEVFIEKPKVLYHRFKRTGTYTWEQVYNVAKKDINNDIMAFVFSYTEVFSSPISLDVLRDIWKDKLGKNFHPQAPIRIPNEIYHSLYHIGMKETNDEERNKSGR